MTQGDSQTPSVVAPINDLMAVHHNVSLLTNTTTDTTKIFTNYSSAQTPQTYQIIWTSEVLFRVITLVTVMALAVVGNTLLLFIIMSDRKQRKKRVNIFLMNLAIGDLMVCLFTMSTEVLFVAFGEWVLGAMACKLIVYGQIVTLASATFLLTGMSIDRFQVIVRPLKAFRAHPSIWKKVVSAWVLAFIIAVPQLFIFVQTNEGVKQDGSQIHLCRSQGYTAKWQRKTYFVFLTTYILLIPTFIMSFCYINIMRVVWKRMDSNNYNNSWFQSTETPSTRIVKRRFAVFSRGSADASDNHTNDVIPIRLVSSSKKNVVKMTFSVIIGFVICWTPYFVVGLIRIFSDYKFKMHIPLAVAEIMALIHSALNPILYCIFSAKLTRHSLKNMFNLNIYGRRTSFRHNENNISDNNNSELDMSCIFANGVISERSMVTIDVVRPSTSSQMSSGTHARRSVNPTSRCCLTNYPLICKYRNSHTRSQPNMYYKRQTHLNDDHAKAKCCVSSGDFTCNTKPSEQPEFQLTVTSKSGSCVSISPPDTPDYRRGSFPLMMESLKIENAIQVYGSDSD